MSTLPKLTSESLNLATIIACQGHAVIPVGYGECSVPGCCAPLARHPWAYTVGLVKQSQPELMLFGGCSDSAGYVINRVAREIKLRGPLAIDVPTQLDGHWMKLVDVPPRWLETDMSRMAMWFDHYVRSPVNVQLPEVRQIVWADACGLFPDDPRCDPEVVAAQPLLNLDPHRYPGPSAGTRRPRHRTRGR